jgi:putative membrane protein
MWRKVTLGVVIALCGVAWFSGSHAQQVTVVEADRAFMAKASQGGTAEISLGQLAASRGATDGVRRFGQRMASEHSAANAQLMALAARKGVALPSDPGAQAAYQRMAVLNGPEFDRAYAAQMVRDHEMAAAEFEAASRTIRDPELLGWVTQTLPVIREHQRMARDLNSMVTRGIPGPYPPVTAGTSWCQGGHSSQGTNFGICPARF